MSEQEQETHTEVEQPVRCFEHQNFKSVRHCTACSEAALEAKIMRGDPNRDERRGELDRSITLGLFARVALVIPAVYFAWSAATQFWGFRHSVVGAWYLVVVVSMVILCSAWCIAVWKKR